MKKKQKATGVTKQNLLNAFWDIYKEKGIDKTTVTEITSVANYNRSTFYEYFTDIYDVLNCLENTLIEYFEEHVVKGLDIFNNEEVIKRIIHFYEEKGDYLCFLLSEKGDPAFSHKLKNKLKPAMFAAVPLQETDPYAAYLFEYIMSATIGTITHWYKSGKDMPLADLIPFIRSIHVNGSMYVLENQLLNNSNI